MRQTDEKLLLNLDDSFLKPVNGLKLNPRANERGKLLRTCPIVIMTFVNIIL